MRFLRRLVFLIFLILGFFFILSFFLPDKASLERSVVVDAPQQKVFNQVNELKNWEKWSPFSQADPTINIAYEGKTVGEGAKYSWKSENSGAGYLQIKESNPPHSLGTYVYFGEQGDGNGFWRFEPVSNNQTKVTWGFNTEFGMNPFQKYFGLMLDRMLGPSYETGLENLKKVSEQ